MARKWAALAAMVMAGTGLLGACSGDSYDRSDFISQLEESGATTEQAECIADGVEGKIDLEALEDQTELTEEQTNTLTEITTECLMGDLGIPTDDSSAEE